MCNWKHKLLIFALAIAVAVPGAAVAAEVKAADENNGGDSAHGVGLYHGKAPHGRHHKGHTPMPFGPHREMYMTLLAEKYTPEDLDEWKAAFAERKQILSELKSLRQTGDGKRAHTEHLQQRKEQAKNGDVTREGLMERLKQWRAERKDQAGEASDERRKECQEFVQAHRELHEAFTRAVESRDAEAIKDVLPKLLEEAKRINQHLAKKLEEAKKKAAESPADVRQRGSEA